MTGDTVREIDVRGAVMTTPTHTPPMDAPLLVHEPEARESNPVVIVVAALLMPVVAGWRLLVAAGRGLRALWQRLAGWAESLLRWLGRGIVAVVRWIGRGLRAVAGLVGPFLSWVHRGLQTLLAPAVRAIGRALTALGRVLRAAWRGLERAARSVGQALRAVGAVLGRMWRALYGPEILHALGRVLVAAGRGVAWVARFVGEALAALFRGIGRAFAAAWRGVAWAARHVWWALVALFRGIGRAFAAAGRGVARVARHVRAGVGWAWQRMYGPELMKVVGGLLASAAGIFDQFLRSLWQGFTSPFRWVGRALLRPLFAAVGDVQRRCVATMRRQWRAVRGSF